MAILDEAQKIKNCGTQIHQASLDVRAQNKLILSGTPIENSLSELWCLFNFVQPGLLGEKEYFEKENHRSVPLVALFKGLKYINQEN